MTPTQLKAQIKSVYDSVSNDADIDPAVGRLTMSNGIGAAVDAFVSSKIANINNEHPSIEPVKTSLVSVIKHLKSLKVIQGNNLDQSVLDDLITQVENI